LILLKRNSGLPCVFYGDLYGSFIDEWRQKYKPPGYGGNVIPKLVLTRRLYAYGDELTYMDEPNCIGFTRCGDSSRSAGAGLAVVINNSWKARTKMMDVGKNHAGEDWTDILCWCLGEVSVDSNGYGNFYVGPRSVSVWVSRNAAGREQLDDFVL
jgi:alpha-amylase